MKKRCVFILPYFGNFNNYFQLFLNSFSYNGGYDLLIFTDCNTKYNYPSNVKVIKTSLSKVKAIAERKFGFEVCLDRAYKLCDFKPAYGLLFEEYIGEYEYWGHCDCDIIFGNLEKILSPLLDKGYDKLFAVGHMTIYKNTYENNRRFMSLHNGNAIYKDAFTSPEIYVFDEDYEKKHNTDNNVHSIFLEAGTRIYADDISMNTVASSAKFIQARYIPERRKFIKLPYVRARYYFENGNLLSISLHNKQLVKTEYLYMHFQMRKMRVDKKITPDCSIEILPDRFRVCKKIPTAIKEFKYLTVGFPYLFWVDVYKRKVRKKLQSKFK